MDGRAKTRQILLQTLWLALSVLPCIYPALFIFSFIPLIILTTHFWVRGRWQNAVLLAVLLALVCVISGGDWLVVLFSIITALGVAGAVLGLKQQFYLFGAALSGCVLVAAALITSIIFCAAAHKIPSDFTHDYVKENLESDSKIFAPPSQIRLAAHIYYLFYRTEKGDKIPRGGEGYEDSVNEVFLIKAWDFGENEFFYALTGMGAISGIACFLAVLLLEKNKAKKPPPAFKDMRLDRKFFLYVFLPVFAFSFLGYIDGLSQIAAAVFFGFAAVPAAFSAFALLTHTVQRIKLKAVRIIFYVLLCALGLVSAVSPSVAIGVSFLGAADMILNLRRLLDFALDNGKGGGRV